MLIGGTMEEFSRTAMLLGDGGLNRLSAAKVAVFGIGGVGGYCAEALARSGVGELHLIDNDVVDITNINRQIIATHETIGMLKTEAAKKRFKTINPLLKVVCHNIFYLPENAGDIDLSTFDYVADAMDTVAAKVELAVRCEELGVPLISSMGTGNKLNPALLEVDDIYSTSVCPLARVMRRLLKERDVKGLKVVYSKEQPITPKNVAIVNGKAIPGSSSFVPSAAGLIMAGEIIKQIAVK